MAYENKEQQNEYNKMYYAKNKEAIMAKLLCKENCIYCNRSVNHQNLIKHQLSKLCLKKRRIANAVL
jgi:wyosine [tRNA(Phe)-imidazoG37] synthetase (radical SAM superfamily)